MTEAVKELPVATARKSSILLSAVAGFVDSAGFITLFGLFPSLVTGDIVSVGIMVTRGGEHQGVWPRLLMLPMFVLAVVSATLVARRARSTGVEPLLPLLRLMTAALLAFSGVGAYLVPRLSAADTVPLLLVGGAAVVAMGIQNTIMREALHGLAPTTVMTGNLTQLIISMVDLMLCRHVGDCAQKKHARNAAFERARNVGLPLVAFFAGVAAGSYLTTKIGLASVLVPALVVAAFARSLSQRRTHHEARWKIPSELLAASSAAESFAAASATVKPQTV